MIDYTKAQSYARKDFDAGLRDYMLKVYNYMAAALAITGLAAFATFSFEPLTRLIFQLGPNGEFLGTTGLGMIMMFAPLGVALLFGFKAATMDVEKSKTLLWVYSALNGVSLSTLAFIYTGDSIIRTFFITSSVFAAMSLYGYTTKKDLTSVGSFLIMGLFGLIIASLANLFFQSAAVHFATSLLGVFIFMGLIAWDTQKLKAIYFSVGGGEMGQRMSVVGAFNLYLDFINMFIYLLRFFGERRNNN
ncbi:MAG: hypothetical protein K0R02_149 [Rickettsiaceae bacterium]|jgi:FtsH-binding integral membrane protein|nr:hypothetical protein [Rickettsiaceae bacterium]